MMPFCRRGAPVLAAALLAAACSDSGPSAPPVPAALEVSGTLPGTAVAGSTLTPAVRVTDSRGNPVSGSTVTFAVTAGGGSVTTASAASNTQGIASPGTWTLGTGVGANTLVASFGSLAPVMITVSGTAGAVAQMAASAVTPATAAVGSALTPVPAVTVTDAFGNPVEGVQVTFTAAGNSGTVVGGTKTTGSNGRAAPDSWTLGTTPGQQTLTASAGALSTVFTVESTPGAISELVRLTDTDQSAAAGAVVAESPSVRAEDAFGNAVSGATITFAVTAGGGSVTAGTPVTNGSGIATVGSWTLGPSAGANTLVATAPGGATATFTATATGTAVVSMAKYAGDATTCPVSRNGCVFSVRVTQGGSPVAGETVVWSNGSGTTVSTTTNIRGIATSANIAPNNAIGARTQVATLQSTGAAVTFDYSLVTDANFNIDVRYIGGTPTAAVQAAFTEARERWEDVITGELSNVQITTDTTQTTCTIAGLNINEIVDDLLILAVVDSIDGPGSVLGSAGPCFIRTSNDLPIVGLMRLDSADLAVLAGNGRLKDVILHEMGHTLGFPALWGASYHNLVADREGTNPYYTGLRAAPGFVIAGGMLVQNIGVPVENTGGEGTRLGHWRESVLSNELMTGFISGNNNPLSAITIGALMDIGYEVNFGAADAYLLPGASGLSSVSGPLLELIEVPLPAPKRVR